MTTSRPPRRRRPKRDPMVVWGKNHLGLDLDAGAKAAEGWIVSDLRNDARSGQSGDDRPLPSLTEGYRARKARMGGEPRANFLLTGDLLRSIRAKGRRRNKKGWIVFTISVPNRLIRRVVGLAAKGKRLFGFSDSDLREVTEHVKKQKLVVSRPGKPEVS